MLLLRAATTPARPLKSVTGDVPEPILALVDKALAFDKPARWESAAAMRDAVAQAYAAEFHEPLTREVLHAYFVALEEAPSTDTPQVPGPEREPTPPPETDALMRTKVEGKGPPAVEPEPPAEPKASPEPEPSPVPPTSAPITVKTPDKAEPTKAPLATPPSTATQKRSVTPLLVGAVLLVALLLGIVALLSGRGP